MSEPGATRTNGATPHGDIGAPALHQLYAGLRRQAPWLMGATILTGALTALLTLRQTPVFEAHVTLRLEEKAGAATTEMMSPVTTPQIIETEIEVLKSRSVAEDVVDAVAFNVSVAAPRRLPRESLLVAVRASRDVLTGTYELQREPDWFSLTAPDGAQARGPYGSPVRVGGLEAVAQPPGAAVRRATLHVREASGVAEELRGKLRVTRPQSAARIVTVALESQDPALTRDAANSVAQSYIERRNQMQKQQVRSAIRFLGAQVQSVGVQLAQAEGALEEFRRSRAVVDPEAQSTEQVRRLADLRARREELEFRRGALRDVLTRLEPAGDTGSGWAALAATPALAGSPAISDVLQQLTTLETDRSRLTAWRTADDPDVRAVQRTFELLTRRLESLARQQLAALDEQAQSQDGVLAGLDAQLRTVPEMELQYMRLRRQVELMSQLHTLLQTRLKETEIAEAVEIANIQIVDRAVTPLTPIRPRKVANIAFGLLAGLLLGLVVALVRELADTVVRSREEIVALTDLPVLAAIPRQKHADGRHDRVSSVESRLVTRHSPRSPAAEAYRSLRTNLAFSSLPKNGPMRTLVVTSAEPQAGKSTTAVNLAVALAEQGMTVLLVEADQRRPVLHRVLHADRVPGLTDMLSSSASLETVRRHIPLPEHAAGTLDFIAGGTTAPNPAELAGSAAMKALLLELGSRYDAVVLDTPPLSLVTDAAVTGAIADGVIVVARMGATHRGALQRAVEELRAIGAPLAGMVLTDVHHSEDRYGQRYDQYYTAEDDSNGGPR